MNLPPGGIPAELRAAANGQLDGQVIIAWAEYDLDEAHCYQRAFVVLTEGKLILLDGNPRAIPLGEIEEGKIVEQLGLDRLVILRGGRVDAELRYSRRHRRDMTRLQRKLQRRLPKKEGEAEQPEWLEAVELAAEEQELCPNCGGVIPAYAEGVCPKCLHKRRVLWRLMDVARPYRRQIYLIEKRNPANSYAGPKQSP